MAKKKHKGSGTYVSFYGADVILKKLETTGEDVNKIMETAIVRASIPIQNDLIGFMKQHEKTGNTLKAYHQGKAKWDSSFMKYGFGWLTNDAGLPALFLDLGTPTIKPSFFTYYARKNNMDKFEGIVMDYLERFLIGVWG